MQRVGEFEKVSFEQFRDAMKDEFYRGQELPPAIEDDLKKMWEEIALPSRATTGSAGYDFKAPFTFEMRPGETMKIPTGIRVKIDEGWWLGCLPRSGLGFKFRTLCVLVFFDGAWAEAIIIFQCFTHIVNKLFVWIDVDFH